MCKGATLIFDASQGHTCGDAHHAAQATEFDKLTTGIQRPTTLMIRNLPRKFVAWDLVRELDLHMDRPSYDFVYVPWDKASLHNMGYGFVNFVDVDVARMSFAALEGQQWQTGMRSRGAKLVPARVQGLAGNLERYAAAGVEPEAGHRPLVFQNGACVDLSSALRRNCPGAAPPLSHPPSPLSSASDDFLSTGTIGSGLSDDALPALPPGLYSPLPPACFQTCLHESGAKSCSPPTPPTPSLPPQSPRFDAHDEGWLLGPPGLPAPESDGASAWVGGGLFGSKAEDSAEERAHGFYAARDSMTNLLLQMLVLGGDHVAAGCR